MSSDAASSAEPPQRRSVKGSFAGLALVALLAVLLSVGKFALGWASDVVGGLWIFFLVWLFVSLLLVVAARAVGEVEGVEADEAEPAGVHKKDMVEGILQFAGETVADIMTARPNVCDLDIDTPFKEALSIIARDGYSRVPVYSGSRDNVVGVLYSKDLLPHLQKGDKFRWSTLLRPAFCVPESKKIDNLLREFQQKKIHIAVVIDEYGGVSGIVTLEDIIEEIVGEINDEYDEATRPYVRLDDGSYIFYGTYGVQDFIRLFGLPGDFFVSYEDEEEGEPVHGDTLAGVLADLSGDVVSRHQKIEYKQFVFEILETTERTINKVKVSPVGGCDE